MLLETHPLIQGTLPETKTADRLPLLPNNVLVRVTSRVLHHQVHKNARVADNNPKT